MNFIKATLAGAGILFVFSAFSMPVHAVFSTTTITAAAGLETYTDETAGKTLDFAVDHDGNLHVAYGNDSGEVKYIKRTGGA